MMWELILFILIVIIIIICGIYWSYNKLNEISYSKPIMIEESTCVVKKGQINGRKRITYRCDDPNGCFYKGKIHKGIFYGIEDCINDKTEKHWEYSQLGPYYGANEVFPGNFSIKSSEMILLDAVSCRICLSLETGHPKEFQDGKIGFTGILVRSKGKNKTPEIQISTKYENSKFHLKRINELINLKETEIILIDGHPYILQICMLSGNKSLDYFKLTSESKYLIIKDNQIFATEHNDDSLDIYFSIENSKKIDGKRFGSLICYKGIHERGWLDKNFKWHSGLSKFGSLFVMLNNNKLTDIKGNGISIPCVDFELTSLSFDVEMIKNSSFFIENRMTKLLDICKK